MTAHSWWFRSVVLDATVGDSRFLVGAEGHRRPVTHRKCAVTGLSSRHRVREPPEMRGQIS
jgi:hypothetical protein